MSRRGDHVTLVPKIIVTKKGLQVWWLLGILLAIALFIAASFAGQVVICRYLHPDKTAWECVRP